MGNFDHVTFMVKFTGLLSLRFHAAVWHEAVTLL